MPFISGRFSMVVVVVLLVDSSGQPKWPGNNWSRGMRARKHKINLHPFYIF